MALYKANSTNSRNFKVTLENQEIGELLIKKWYSFDADLIMSDGKNYQLITKGFWDSKVELIDGSQTLLDFKMGWKGIVIKTYFDNQERQYLLKLQGFINSKFILIDESDQELSVASTDFKWLTLNFNYDIETSASFDQLRNRDLLLMTMLHCMNYYISYLSAAT
ncbi:MULTISPECIES: hypothetical protein [unclassified Sphingobacterium]|uniref:hypothetical protein n=1 Tax=unclassified Sphingobacterium TaxID=2609468 RepID=UPI0020C53A54|nr:MULTISPECIES: hypothetical protein [unclassified Sphingobacterium]